MYIRDPIHGDIDLTPLENKVLDTPELQRLRAIKQLGTAYLVYPGCTHTRFEHSLGTLAVAKRLIEVLEKNKHPVSTTDKTLIAITALLHDITHIPFGHTFEDERKLFTRHDKGTRLAYFLRDDSTIANVLRDYGILQDVKAMLNGSIADWRTQIIASSLDADLLDYLRRDAFMSGLAQTYDERIFQHFALQDGQLVLKMVKHNMDRPDVKSEIIHLLRLRYYLTERVYFHHAKVISGAMISKALEIALNYGLTEQELFSLGDYSLFHHLKILGRKHNPAITALIESVENRQLLKRAYILSPASLSTDTCQHFISEYHHNHKKRTELERIIASESGLDAENVIVYCPEDRTFREAAIPVLTKSGLHKLNSPFPHPPEDIKYLEVQYKNLWRFCVFAPADALNKVKNICRNIFELPSEHY